MDKYDELCERLDGSVCYASTTKEWPNDLLQQSSAAIRELKARVADLDAAFAIATRSADEQMRYQREAEAELARLKAPVAEGEIAEAVRKLRASMGYCSGPQVEQVAAIIESLAAKVAGLERAWKAQQFHLEAEERESEHWQQRAERAEAELAKLKSTRAGKLLAKGKQFVVVACDEPYYLTVYAMIRDHEIAKGGWSDDDEAAYRADFPKE